MTEIDSALLPRPGHMALVACCLGCGAYFRPKRSDNVYCSHACRTRAYRSRASASASP